MSEWLGIAGPTAAGKSAVVMSLADHLTQPIEVVTVDSAQVYRGMDIGTAKPSATERERVPHHLIDLIEPQESYSAARFVTDARQAIANIRGRGALPVLVGGTMLYFKALIEGLDELPAADPKTRAELELETAERGQAAMHAELARVDPVSAARLAVMDQQRVQRALEVFRITGLPLSSFHRGRASLENPPTLIALESTRREWLHQRIDERLVHMLRHGLVDEVQSLRNRPGVHAQLPAMRCVGYRQVWQALDAGLQGEALIQEVRRTAGAATRQLAKRQLTWLRSMPWRHVVACDHVGTVQEVTERAAALISM